MHTLADVLKSVMRTRQWSQARLGQEFGVSQEWVSKVTRGKLDPGIGKISRLLDHVGWEVRIVPKGEETDPVKRRQFLTVAASVAFVPSASANPYRDPAYVHTLAKTLNEGLYDHGGIPILPTAIRHVRHLESALTGDDRHLQAAASDLAFWAAWIARDAGRFDTAEHLGRLALALAERAGDQEAQSAACSALSKISANRHRLDQAVMYAQRGIAFQEITDERRAWLYVRLGDALARVGGQEYSAHDALARAQGFAENLPNVVDTADLIMSAGGALSKLRAYEDAYSSLGEAVRLSGDRSPLLRADTLCFQAVTALHAADPLFAADRMFGLARVTPLISSSRLDKKLNELLAISARWTAVPEIRSAREQLHTIRQPITPDA
ncbi:hypothetical protein GCM10023259_072820 [Thermocatellispora tengchongensis]